MTELDEVLRRLDALSAKIDRLAQPDRLWSLAEVATHFGVSRTKAEQLVARPDFPAPASVFGVKKRRRRWRQEDVKGYDVQRVA